MKKVIVMIVCCGINVCALAGDTNFVEAFNAVWLTHDASNVLVFVEQNVATNASPEVLFVRGIIAMALQDWVPGATNYWEQAIQMVTTNSLYSEKGKTNAVNQIQFFQRIFIGSNTNPPSWHPEWHEHFFTKTGDEAPFLNAVRNIATIPLAETP